MADLRGALTAAGARPAHVRLLLRAWLQGRPLEQAASPRTPRLSFRLLERLPAIASQLDALACELSSHAAGDGACRRLLRMRSGRTVECVDLPRRGLCVSTQVGCAVGCRFCRTGAEGLIEQLGALEILAQVVHARARRDVRRVVFMGMGEPAHNLEAVLEAATALGTEGGLAHKDLVLSTVGEAAVFERMARGSVRPALALSLHTLDADLRAELLPRAPRVEPDELLAQALDYADRTTYPLLVQWTLLSGVNESREEALRLSERLRGRRAIVNYIPFNPVEGAGFERPPIERCVELVRAVKAAGVLATLRRSAGAEVEGACGQLRARAADQFPGAAPESSATSASAW